MRNTQLAVMEERLAEARQELRLLQCQEGEVLRSE